MDTTPDLDAATTIIGALDSRLRMQIVLRLAEQDHFVHELVQALGKSQPLISQHLRVLKKSGIVDSSRRGREVIYRLIQPVAPEIIDLAASAGRDSSRPIAPVTNLEVPARTEQQIHIQPFAHTPAAAAPPPAQGTSPIPDPSVAPPLPSSPMNPL